MNYWKYTLLSISMIYKYKSVMVPWKASIKGQNFQVNIKNGDVRTQLLNLAQ